MTDGEVIVVYLSYPYSESPVKLTEEGKVYVRELYNNVRNIVILLPHLVFDAVWDFPSGYKYEEVAFQEINLIGRCDALIWVEGKVSHGVIWEKAIARRFGVPVYEYSEFMAKFKVLKSHEAKKNEKEY